MIDPEHEVPDDVVSFSPILSHFSLLLTLSATYSLISTGWWSSTNSEQEQATDQPSPGISSFSDRPQRAKFSSPDAPNRPFQENDHQIVKNFSIDSCRHSSTSFRGKFSIFLSHQFHPILTLFFQGASATTGTSSVTSLCTRHFILQQISTIFFCFYI